MLTRIVATKRTEIEQRRASAPLEALRTQRRGPVRDFTAAMRAPGVSAIAEIKRRSPSKGMLRAELEPAAVALQYAHGGAAALSVLTDFEFFAGTDEDLRRARGAVPLPVLRKDFTLDDYQVHEAAALGADAILLIVRILEDSQLGLLLESAGKLGLAALVEVHDQVELRRALGCGAELIGVNSRDLDTFEVDLQRGLALLDRIPDDCIAVAESGIRTREDVLRAESAGCDAILVGEALMRAANPGVKLAELLGRVDPSDGRS